MRGVMSTRADQVAGRRPGLTPISQRRRGASTVIVLGLLLIGGAAAAWYFIAHPSGASPTATVAAPPAVPVTAGVATARDVPVYLRGLGAVQAFNTVSIRARVDGQLQKVPFVEGQHVKAGDLLAQIDPRTFQPPLPQYR